GRVEQRELFEDTAQDAPSVPVRLQQVRLERGRSFGDVWLGWTLWRALKLDTLCAELLPEGREAVPWGVMAAVLVIARLCEPSSELYIAEDWFRRTALGGLLSLPGEAGDALRPGAAHLGDGSRHGERGQPELVAGERPALPDRRGA